MCMTKGVVSRVTSKGFAVDHFPSPAQLAIQIDAAINPGNSGGPALYSPKEHAKPVCLGVATQKVGALPLLCRLSLQHANHHKSHSVHSANV